MVYRFTGLQAYRLTGLQAYRLTGLQAYRLTGNDKPGQGIPNRLRSARLYLLQRSERAYECVEKIGFFKVISSQGNCQINVFLK